MRVLLILVLSFITLNLVNGHVTTEVLQSLCRTNSWTELDLKVFQDENDVKRITSDRCAVHFLNLPLERLTKKIMNLLPKQNLKILQISGKLQGVDDDFLSSFGFLKYLVLPNVDLENSDIFGGKGVFSQNVEHLDLSWNHLSNVSFLQTESERVKKIDLEVNRLLTVPEELKNFPNLEELSMYHNEIVNISLQQTLPDVKYLDLSRNSIVNLTGLRHFPNVVYLNLSDNMIKDMTDEYFQEARYQLEELLLDTNMIEYISLPIIFNFPKLKVLTLEHNRLRKIIPTVINNTTMVLEHLNLGRNELDEIPYNFLRWFPLLKTLKLDRNKLSYLRTGTFVSLNNLRDLDLSHNEFVNLDVKRLIPLESLHVLHLSNNKIETIDYSSLVSHVPSLERIDIDGNSLFCENLVEMLNYFENSDVIVEKGQCLERSHIRSICCDDTAKNYTSYQSNLIPISIIKRNQKKLDELLEKFQNMSHGTEGSSQPLQDNNISISKSTFWTGVGIIIGGLIMILCVLVFSIMKKEKVVLPVHI